MVCCPSCHLPKVFNVVIFVVEGLLIYLLKHEMKGDETRQDEIRQDKRRCDSSGARGRRVE